MRVPSQRFMHRCQHFTAQLGVLLTSQQLRQLTAINSPASPPVMSVRCSCNTATSQRFPALSDSLRSITHARSPFTTPKRSSNVTRARKVGPDDSSTDMIRDGVGDLRERVAFSLEGFFKSSAEALQVQPLLEELSKGEDVGKRGELWLAAQADAVLVDVTSGNSARSAAAQIGLLAVLFFPPGPLEGLVRVAGIGAVVAGLALAAAGQQSLGNSLSPFPTPRRADNHALITDGVYQYTRYGGLLLLAFGLSAASGNDLRFAFSFALYYVLNEKVKLEERALEERYSSAYEQYRSKAEVKKFIPWIL